ncbi:hypothetical protein BSKO_08036 [Bryopsis sp. KO-2023]|nr:hypothetical protein BSKO_08036 [Bryopsis sp. KO-2023]
MAAHKSAVFVAVILGVLSLTQCQQAPRREMMDAVRQLLTTEKLVEDKGSEVSDKCSECPAPGEDNEITIFCCRCLPSLEVVEILTLEICVDTSWVVDGPLLEEIVTEYLIEGGVDLNNQEEVAEAFNTFIAQEVSLDDFAVRESGEVAIVSRRRDVNRDVALKAKYNDKTKDVAVGLKRDNDYIANTQVGLVEHRAGRLNEITATKIIDRSAKTGKIKAVNTDIHKDTAIELAGVLFVPRPDPQSIVDDAGTFIRPFFGGIGDAIG